MLGASPSAPVWRRAVERYGVIILFTFAGIDFLLLWQFCVSDEWAPFYLNQTAVFGRRRPENEDLIRRLRITCPLCTDRARELRLQFLEPELQQIYGGYFLALRDVLTVDPLLQSLGRR